jgi:hypothetical protein
MKRCFIFAIISLMLGVPALLAQTSEDHVEVGAFADYFRLSSVTPEENFLGIGGRAAFNVTHSVQIEGEMAYDFRRSFTTTTSNSVTTTAVTSHLRPLHGFVGPKLQTGSGPFRFFVTGKAGFENFNVTNSSNAPAGFENSVTLGSGTTRFAVYPGGGIEAFAGPFGVRAEVGDDIYFLGGAHNNLRITLGPQFRF